jgi:3-phosphoshikimate 1-carboxyvinyltransferase
MDAVIAPARRGLRGRVRVPSDKAICHRIALACSVASGVTEVSPWSTAKDCRHTLEAMRQLGVKLTLDGARLRIEGAGVEGLRAPAAPIHCGDSGTTMRLLAGLLAGQPFASRITGSPQLLGRPMRRIVDPLVRMGARVEGASGFHPNEIYPPLAIAGRRPLEGLTYAMPIASAQVKSAILLAGLASRAPVTVVEPSSTRDHTERLLQRLGASVHRDGRAVTLEPVTRPLRAPGRLTVPGDPSSAAFLVVAAAIVPGSQVTIEGVGLNPSRMHFLTILRRMGASIQEELREEWEPQGSLAVEGSALRAVTVGPDEVPLVIDELPALMAAAAVAQGTSRFEALAELRVKETDRLQSMLSGLSRMGAEIETIGASGLRITGGPLRGAVVDSFGDHRTVMSLALAGLAAEGETTIRGAECVGKSFGEFFDVLASVAGPDAVRVR